MTVEGDFRDDDLDRFLDQLFDGVEDRPCYGGQQGVSDHPDLPQLPMRRLSGDYEGITGRAGREAIVHHFPTGQEDRE